MKKFVKKVSRAYGSLLGVVPTKLKICSLILVLMVFAELYVNNAAISRLMDADASVSGILRSGVVALFMTALIVVLGIYGGDRAKRYYHSVARGAKPDGSQIAIAIACALMNALLIAVITYIRFQVGAKGGGSNEDVFASTAQDVSGYSTAAGGFSTPEVVLLAAILGAAAVFSFILAFVSTDPLDGEKKRALGLVELEAEKSLAAASSARLEEFSEASLELIGWHCDAVRWRARDQIIVALCHLASDPAIATRLTRNPPSILRSSSLREDSSRSDARELG